MKFLAYIVEDSLTTRENLIETLQELALVEPVGTADTEREGKKWLAQNDNYWHLAIVDLFLKDGSGLNILDACRFREPNQKMIVLSNYATNDVRWRCAQLGADAVFDKSTEIEKFIDYCVAQREKVEHRLLAPMPLRA
ncbi:MAG: response regulator [Ramlibacter sp.]|nr:response regulator [Ramlibacter sp.]